MSRPTVESFRYGAGSGFATAPRASSFLGPSQPRSEAQNLLEGAGEKFQTVSDFLLALPHPRYWPGLLFSFFVLDPLRALASNVIALITSSRTHRVILRLSILISLFWAALVLAILAYIGFYRAWVPEVGRIEELYLQYGKQGEIPYAEVDLSRWRGLGRSSPGDDWFAEEQEYDLTVELLVPISAANLDLGNFMVSVDLVTNDGQVVFRSSRPTILRPSNPPMRYLAQVANQYSARPSLAGSSLLPLPFTSPSLELMTIKLFERLVLHPSPGSVPFANPAGSPLEAAGRQRRITKAIVRVGRADADRYWAYGGGHGVGGVVVSSDAAGSRGGDANGMIIASQGGSSFRSRGELQTVSAGVRFDARLRGLRYFLYTHPVISFVVFTSLFLAFELVSALTLWVIAAVYTSTLPGLDVDLGSDAQFVTPGRTRGERARRPAARNSSETPSSGGSDAETITDGENQGNARSRAESLASLRARDEAERREARATAEEHARRSGRLMTAGADARSGTDSPEDLLTPTYGRRVLGRLDEETEEETDGHESSASAGADSSATTLSGRLYPAAEQRDLHRARQATVVTASPSLASGEASEESLAGLDESQDSSQEGAAVLLPTATDTAQEQQQREGVRRRKAFGDAGDQYGEDESTLFDLGEGSSSLRGSATDPSLAGTASVRSFGATTEASRRTGASSATGMSSVRPEVAEREPSPTPSP
ncbi:unnamed protein product [Parajaminaea phylloscopi]